MLYYSLVATNKEGREKRTNRRFVTKEIAIIACKDVKKLINRDVKVEVYEFDDNRIEYRKLIRFR